MTEVALVLKSSVASQTSWLARHCKIVFKILHKIVCNYHNCD